MIQLFVLLYLILLLFIGIHSSRKIKTSSDYFVANKKGGTWAITGSLLATVLGSSAILGTANLTSRQGWAASWMILAVAIGFFALLPFAKRVYNFGKFTLPELLGRFYGKNAKTLASIAIPLAWIGIVAAQIIGAAKLMNTFVDISYQQGVFISGSIFIIYTLLGGQISIIKTDFYQSLFIIVGICCTSIFLFTTGDIAFQNLNAATFPFNESFKVGDLVILLLTYSSTILVGPDVYSRIFCSSSADVAKKAVRNTAFLLLPAAFLVTYLGVYANNYFPESNSEEQINLMYLIVSILPNWASALFISALLSAIVSSADTTLLTAAIICTDPIANGLEKKSALNISRVLVMVLGILSMIVALKITSIIQALLFALSFYSGAFILPIFIGLIGKKVSSNRAIIAMTLGGVIAVSGKYIATSGELFSLSIDKALGNWIIVGAFVINGLILLFPTGSWGNRVHQ